MRKLNIALVLALAVAQGGSASGSQQYNVMVPVRRLIEGFNKTDIKMAQAACDDETFIIDDFSPHEWRGSGATSKWLRDLIAMGKKNGMSRAFVTLGKPRRIEVAGTHAYAVVPVNLRYDDKGRMVKTNGLMTVALHKSGEGWRVAAWAWTWGQ